MSQAENIEPPPPRGVGLLLSVACALGVFISLHFTSPPTRASTVPPPKRVEEPSISVIAPAADIPSGTRLERSMFVHIRRPASLVTLEMIRRVDELEGLFAHGLLVRKQPLYRESVTHVRPVEELQTKIPPGHRAIALPVHDEKDVDQWTNPDNSFDIVWSGGAPEQGVDTVIASNVRVLTFNDRRRVENGSNESATATATVTVLLSSLDSLRARLASLEGKLRLQLREAVPAADSTPNVISAEPRPPES